MMNSTKETMIMITWTLGNATEQFFSPLEGRFELSVVIKFELMASTWIIRKKLSMMHLFILFHLKIFCFWLNCRSILYSTHCFRQDNDASSTKLSMLPSWYWKELVKLSTRNLQPLDSLSSWLLVFPCNIYFRKHNNGVVILWLLTWKTLFSFFNFCTPM